MHFNKQPSLIKQLSIFSLYVSRDCKESKTHVFFLRKVKNGKFVIQMDTIDLNSSES